MKAKDLTGQRFGRLVAIERTERHEPSNGCYFWRCICDCGRTHYANTNNLTMGAVKSCGCLKER